MQNLAAASANLQLFSKALQEGQSAGDGHDLQQNGGGQAAATISATDLQQFMLSQLDQASQQLYLSQLAGYGSGQPETTASSALFPGVSSGSSDTATTTASTGSQSAIHESGDQRHSRQDFGASSSANPSGDDAADSLAQRAQLAQQKLMEQFLEAAAAGNPLDATNGQNAEEIGQIMAQLMGANGAGGGSQDLQAQLAQLANASGQLQQQRGDAQSPSQQMSLMDQLQLLQMLGSPNGAGLADLLANAGASFPPNSMGDAGQGMKGGGSAGGSPNKEPDTYCSICNKYVCNRYFLKNHMARKHGIGSISSGSPVKANGGNFFAQHMDEQGRAQSVSLQPSDSPTTIQKQKQSISSTPGLGANITAGGASSSLNDSLSAEQQQHLMSQCIMQQLAAQLGLPAPQNAQQMAERPELIEQLLGAGLPLAELLQQQAGRNSPMPAQSPPLAQQMDQIGSISCPQCQKQLPSQSALFQHQLAEHIGASEQQQLSGEQMNPLGMRWPMGSEMAGNGGMQQQQQFLGQLLGSAPFPPNNPPLMLPPFGQLNPSDMDGAAMLAKLSAELAAVSQAQGTPQQGQGLLQQNGILLGSAAMQPNKGPPQKRQYTSTSKNFCDLCNKEVCNKYFLRTHMLKMHNIVIDENKVVIANIDTAEKERKGEVKFRCEICTASMTTREQLRAHKREMHGMAPIGPLHTPPSKTISVSGQPRLPQNAMETAGIDGQKLSSAGAFPLPPFGGMGGEQPRGGETMKSTEGNDENQPMAAERAVEGDGAAESALPNSMKQLLNQLIGGDPLLGPGRIPSNRESEEAAMAQQQNDHHRHPDANNNASCRFCGLCLDSEEQMQLHQLMAHMDLIRPAGDHAGDPEDKLVTQVALQMAEANSQKAALRKSSAASSGASSSSSASASSSTHHVQPVMESPKVPSGHPCPQCKRTYKSVARLEQHQRIVHHNFVAKISPTKRPIISPKSVTKLVKCFTCMKCQTRFGTKKECNEHVISAHLRRSSGSESPTLKRAKLDESEMCREEGSHLLTEWVREEENADGELGRLIVDEGEEEAEEADMDKDAGNGGNEKSRPGGQKQGGEKHSHTSGSTSPVSVQASSSSLVPEGFAHPPPDHQKPFVLQSFTVRSVPAPEGGHQQQQALPEELVAYLPVRSTLSQPFRVTLELHPNQQLDAQVRHL